MLSLLPSFDASRPLRLLCIGAHSDDLEIGCGGTVMSWLESAHPVEVTWVVLTAQGERAREARSSAESLLGSAAALLMFPMSLLLMKLWDIAQGLADLGQLYLHNEAFAPKAVAYLDRAIALSPNNGRFYHLRAVGLAKMNETARAAADWQKATELAPGDPEPQVHQGVDRLRRGAVQEALHSFESALALDPRHARAHAYLAAAFEQLEDAQRAFEHYDRAVALGKDDAKVFCDRSFAYFRRGDYASALKDAKRAVRLEERLGNAYVACGQALLMLGRHGDARVSFEEALEVGLEPAMHEQVLLKMESLNDDGDQESD